MPGHAATIAVHKDSQYERHQEGEINFWIPLTSVWGNNTLFAESQPGRGDYRPFEMEPGTGVRFNGRHCRHHTNPNDTGSTRVSIDFRVVPKSLWRDAHHSVIGDYKVSVLEGPIELLKEPRRDGRCSS